MNKKTIELLCCVFGGYFGLHYFVNGNTKMGFIYLFTLGLFGIGWIIDIIKYLVLFIIEVSKYIDNDKLNNNDNINMKTSSPHFIIIPEEIYANAYIDRKQNKIVSDYVVFDTETTGLNPEIDKIIELSAIKFINNEKVESFSMLVNPMQELEPYITELTGIKQSELYEKPTIQEALPHFFNFIENYTLVAHNAPFDIKMLACECYRNNINLCDNKIIDTLPLIKKVISKDEVDNYKLETLKNYLGINSNSHRALDDCETCAKLYQFYLSKNENKKIK